MPRIAISLGASFLGYATHAGFMAGLHDRGVRPVAMAGASAGALAAGLYASGLPQEQIKAAVLGHALRLSFAWHTVPLLHAIASFAFSRQPSFFRSTGAPRQIETLVGSRRIEDLQSPRLNVVVTDLTNHRSHFAKTGPLAVAMAASCCVPVMFSPIEFEGMMCHDGGIVHELPIDCFFDDDEVDVIIAHRIIPPPAHRSRIFPMNIIEMSGAAHETVSHQLLHYRQLLAEKAGKKIIFADTYHARPPLLFGRKLPECYELGYRSAQELHDKTLRPLLDA